MSNRTEFNRRRREEKAYKEEQACAEANQRALAEALRIENGGETDWSVMDV